MKKKDAELACAAKGTRRDNSYIIGTSDVVTVCYLVEVKEIQQNTLRQD